jgi:hypothetical protein
MGLALLFWVGSTPALSPLAGPCPMSGQGAGKRGLKNRW